MLRLTSAFALRFRKHGRYFRIALAPIVILSVGSCEGEIITPPGPLPGTTNDLICPSAIPDQDPATCPRIKNITLSCGGNGMLHTSLSGGSGKPTVISARLSDDSVLSAVFVVFNCQDGPREAITFGVTYSGRVRSRDSEPPCISESKAYYSQFEFGDPNFSRFEGQAKEKMHQTLDDNALFGYADKLGLQRPALSRCDSWRETP